MNADFDQLKTFITYEVPESAEPAELPEEFYFYNDVLSDGRVGIIGRTAFVKGGEGISGARDTSFSHKYIFTGEDYEKLLTDASAIFETRRFFESAEGFLDGVATAVCPDMNGAGVPGGIDSNLFVQLLYCCIEAFSDPERRVYIILPENNRKGSMTAALIMKNVLKAVPCFLLANAGFLTYSPTFASNTLNPVPNSVSVVFISRTQDNLYRSGRLPGANFVFDFSEGYYPNCEIDPKTYNTIYAMWTRQNVREAVNDFLYGIFMPGAKLGADVFAHILVLARDLNTDEKEKLLRDKCEAVLAIISREASNLAENGISMLDGNVRMILQNCSFDSFYLDFFGRLYGLTPVYRSLIVDALTAEACRRIDAAESSVNQDNTVLNDDPYGDNAVLDITDFEYADVKLNDDILVRAYSDRNCYKIGEILFLASVEPVMSKQSLPMVDRISKVLEFIGNNLMKDFSDFVYSFCVEYVEYYADYYLNDLCRAQAASYGIALNGRQDLCSLPSGKVRVDIAEAYFEAVRGLEKLMGQYASSFGPEYRSFIGNFCSIAVAALEGDYRVVTAQENRDLFEEWQKKYSK